MPRADEKLVELDLHFHFETMKAIFVSENGIKDSGCFLSKYWIKWGRRADGSVVVTCPEWIAKERGLLCYRRFRTNICTVA